jgi:hypothetical protein
MHNTRVLFILKRREDYSTDLTNFNTYTVSTGMYNSASFVSNMLCDAGVKSKVAVVIDNNGIDREVHQFKPTHVFIEGYWVVPEKFDVLKPLHPTVKWFVRCHSETPFLAQEGIAMQWTFEYLKRGIGVAGNSPRVNRELRVIAKASSELALTDRQLEEMMPLLTNYYPVSHHASHVATPIDDVINVGCFGAFRPLKNHMIQAMAAIDYAEQRGLTLNFHVNSGRVEMAGGNQLKNLKALFDNLPQHQLIEHPWASHAEFLELINEMDICLQVSFTETFNIVSADSVNLGVPTVPSREIVWMHAPFADPTSTTDIAEKMGQVLSQRNFLVEKNREKLRAYSQQTKTRWLNFLKGEHTRSGLKLDILSFIGSFFN